MSFFFLFFALSSGFLFGQASDPLDYPNPLADDGEAEWNPDLSLVNLEDWIDDFVLETRKIEIPGYPTSFNPSLARWGDALLLCFRIRHPVTASTDQIGLVWIGPDFRLISEPKVLNVRKVSPYYPSKQQDARLIPVGDRLFIVFSNSIEGIKRDVRRMYYAELHIDGDEFTIEKPECITRFAGASDQRWEKNWTPFDCGGRLFFAYSLFPHRILFPIPGTGSCESVSSTFSEIQWDWGVLRGGTPALILDGGEYLAFFHSSISLPTTQSNGKKIPHYFMGAYTFSSYPPFSIARISPKPIVGKHFYCGPAYKTWKPLRVVFPCGYIMDNRFVWIVYGKQDHEIWVAKLDKEGLLNSLVDCNGKR